MEFTPKPMTDNQWRYWEQEEEVFDRKCAERAAKLSGGRAGRSAQEVVAQPTCSWIPIGILLRVNASLGTSPNI